MQMLEASQKNRRIKRSCTPNFTNRHTLEAADFNNDYNRIVNGQPPVNLPARTSSQNTIIERGSLPVTPQWALDSNGNPLSSDRGHPVYEFDTRYIHHNPRTGAHEARSGPIRYTRDRSGNINHMEAPSPDFVRTNEHGSSINFDTNVNIWYVINQLYTLPSTIDFFKNSIHKQRRNL